MNLPYSEIDAYLHAVTPARDAVHTDMEALAAEKGFPIIGPLVGRFLFQIARAIDARRILELGSGFGYSAYWFARATSDNAKIFCTEGTEQNREHAKEFFERAGLWHKIDFRVGDALTLIDEFDGFFDIILCDIDKHQYPAGFEKAVPRVRKGGVFITDNILWSGKVMDHTVQDADTTGIRTFTRLVYESDQLATTILPLRDGIAFCVKL